MKGRSLFSRTLATVMALSGVGLGAVAQATTVFIHTDALNPVSEGWTQYTGSGGATTAGPVVNDLGSGLDAWAIDDNSTGFDTGLYYYENLTGAQVTEGNTAGWRLSVRVRVVNTPDGFASVAAPGSLFSAVSAMYRDGSRDWYLGMGSDASGNPLVRLPDGSQCGPTTAGCAIGALGSGYHFYELVYDPGVLSATFLIDGVVRKSGIVGVSLATTARVLFGATTSPDAGQGNYNLVRFATSQAAIVPVPAAQLLLASALGGLAAFRRRS